MLNRVESSIDNETKIREILLELEDPIILQRWYCPVLVRGESVQQALAGMYYEFVDPALGGHRLNEIFDVLILIQVIDS